MSFLKKLFWCIISWHVKYATQEEIKNADAVIAFSFGGRDEPGRHCDTNVCLASIARSVFRENSIQTIAQWEIASLLQNELILSIKESRINGQYLDTYEVAYQAYEICKKHGFQDVLVLAHKHHAWRCKKILDKLGLNTYVLDTDSCPYDSNSNQRWTRSAFNFISREIFVRISYFLQGKI